MPVKDCKAFFVANISESLKPMGYAKKNRAGDTLFCKKTPLGHHSIVFHFTNYGFLGVQLGFGVRWDLIESWKKPIHNIIIARNIKSDIRDMALQSTWEISWDSPNSQSSRNTHEVHSVSEVPAAIELILGRCRTYGKRFFARFDKEEHVVALLERNDPELKALFGPLTTSMLVSGVATLLEFRGHEAALRFAEQYPEEFNSESGNNIKAVLYQDSSCLASFVTNINSPRPGPDDKTTKQLLDEAAKEFDELINLKKKQA